MATSPEAFRILTGGLTLPGSYRFRSLTLNVMERRIDGVFEPEGHSRPVYIVEFQGQFAQTAWYNLIVKVSLYGEAHPEQDVRGILIFLNAALAPRHPSGISDPAGGSFPAVYLDQFLPEWLAREPDRNPAADKCAAMPDLKPDDCQRFVCVEAVTVGMPVKITEKQ